jgi:Na+/H+-dicarboxylate symporter
MKLWQKVLLGLILGVFFGIFASKDLVMMVKPIGDLFLSLIKMVIMPLIFFSLISGINGISDPSSLGRIGVKAAVIFIGTTVFAVIFGVAMALILKPGVGTVIPLGDMLQNSFVQKFDVVKFLLDIVPSNPVLSFVEANMLQIVFFSIFVGIAINRIGAHKKELVLWAHSLTKVFIIMIGDIIKLSPYAAFALIAWVVSMQGLDILFSLSKLVFAVVISMSLQYIIYGLMIFIFCKLSPIPFYKKSIEYQVIAFSSASSKATLPTAMQVANEKLGVSESATSFLLPLGAALNMNGLAINLSLTAIFFAQMLNISLDFHDYAIIIFTSTLGAIGGAGIPGASLIMLPMILSSINLPIEGVAILAGIDRILDMLRTTINITGDVTMTLIIDHSEGNLDRKLYYTEEV